MEGYQVNGLAFAEFRFKRDWERRRGGWVQARSVATNVWHPLKYVRSLRAADRYVRKVMVRRNESIQYVELPIKEEHFAK